MLKIERPWTRQPTGAALIRESIAATLVWNGARPEVEYVGGYKTAAIGTNLIGSGIGGQGIQFTSVSSGISVGVTSDAIKSLSTATIAIYRRHTDTTNRNSVVFSNGASSTDTITVYGPWGDGNAYFDWGNSTVGSGRLSAAFGAKTTDYEALVCVAGGGKGREIWRNGIRLGANTSATASITSSSAVLRLGFLTSGIAGDLENVALLVVSSRAWSDTEIVAWSRNPYGATFAPRRIWVPVTAAPTGPTVVALPPTIIGANTFRPRYTWTP